jgi:hypothetical protein
MLLVSPIPTTTNALDTRTVTPVTQGESGVTALEIRFSFTVKP